MKQTRFEHELLIQKNSMILDRFFKIKSTKLVYPRVKGKRTIKYHRRKKKTARMSTKSYNLGASSPIDSEILAMSMTLTTPLPIKKAKRPDANAFKKSKKKKDERFSRFMAKRTRSRTSKNRPKSSILQWILKKSNTKKIVRPKRAIPKAKYKLLKRSEILVKKNTDEIQLKSIPDLNELFPEWTDSEFLKNFQSIMASRKQAKAEAPEIPKKKSLLIRTIDNELEEIMSRISQLQASKTAQLQSTGKSGAGEKDSGAKGALSRREAEERREKETISRLISKAAKNIARNTSKMHMKSITDNLSKIKFSEAMEAALKKIPKNVIIPKYSPEEPTEPIQSEVQSALKSNLQEPESVTKEVTETAESPAFVITKRVIQPKEQKQSQTQKPSQTHDNADSSAVNLIARAVEPVRREPAKQPPKPQRTPSFSKKSHKKKIFSKSLPPISTLIEQEPPTWSENNPMTSIISRKFNVNELNTKAKRLRKQLTAASFIVYDSYSGKTLLRAIHRTKREMASLTKIATFYSAFKFMSSHRLDLSTTLFEISGKAAETRGTSARLKRGFFMSVKDLLHGLMLPSGNDAAVCLAENIGRLIRISNGENPNPKILNYSRCVCPDSALFIDLMNQDRKSLGMKNSNFMNPHGLNNPKNFSTCEDLLVLCQETLKIDLFRKIVQCREYRGSYHRKRDLNIPKMNSFNNLKRVDVESGKNSRNQTPKESSRHMPLPVPSQRGQESASREAAHPQLNSGYLQSLYGRGTGQNKSVTFSEKMEIFRDSDPTVHRFEFVFSNRTGRSILKLKKMNNRYSNAQAGYGKVGYGGNHKRTPSNQGPSKPDFVTSKRQFYNKMRGMYIKNQRDKKHNKYRSSSKPQNNREKQRKSNPGNRLQDNANQISGANRGRGGRAYNSYLQFNNPGPSYLHSRTRSVSSRPVRKRNSYLNTPAENNMDFGGQDYAPRSSSRPSNSRSQRSSHLSADVRPSADRHSRNNSASNEAAQAKRKAQRSKLSECRSVGQIQQVLMEKDSFAYDRESSQARNWKNTNILLGKDESYRGIKTGNTPNAKFCLASLHCLDNREIITSKSHGRL